MATKKSAATVITVVADGGSKPAKARPATTLAVISSEQRLAIIAEVRAGIIAEEKERVSAAKLASAMARLLPGLQSVPLDDNDDQFNVVGKGYYGLSSGTSVAWSVVQVADGFRYRYGHGEIFGVGGCTGKDRERFELDASEWVMEGCLGEVMRECDKCVAAAVKAKRAYILRPSKAAAKAAQAAQAKRATLAITG